jgi:hypothetical protein
MKYFVADPSADMGIRQLGEEKVTLLENGSLQYRHPRTGELHTVASESWATDWDKTAIGAYNRLNEEIGGLEARLQQLLNARAELIASSPRLQRITKQLKLF